ncbi:MAG: S8 family peptidase [Bacteroidales bacterium]|nr:S8 family peptidase [Bacteroidales bacterium]
MKKCFIYFLFNVLFFYLSPQNYIVIKFKNNEKDKNNKYIESILQKYDLQIESPFDYVKPDKDLEQFNSNIKNIKIITNKNNNLFTEYIINKLSKPAIIEYCEKKDIPILFYEPNDPGIGAQYYLNNIDAFEAWNIYKGDTNVVIGIVDTGTDLVHEDLWQNIAYNWNDIIDGYDNDSDGFIDNFWGWDIGDNDNSPQWSENKIAPDPHGVYVSGYCSATTDNHKGISGVGFKCRFLPVKIKDSIGTLLRAYEGVVFAAEHNCKIINCSWGSTTPSKFAKDIINYVTYNKKCLIISAAGNNGNTYNSIYYPAAYDEVVCVAATNQYNQKWHKSCYGKHIDVCAPGENVYTTLPQNSYGSGWGTSFASPIVAGQAALIYGYYNKKLHPLQIKAIIENSATNIDTIPANQMYAGMLGKGLINVKKSLHIMPQKYVHLIDYNFADINDTGYLSLRGINLFKPLTNLKLSLIGDTEINVFNNPIIYGFVDSLEIFELNNNLFAFTYNKNKYDFIKEFSVLIEDDNYLDYKNIKIKINPSYKDLVNGNLIFTVCANGKLGFNDNQNSEGNGLLYKSNQSLISSMGIVILHNNKYSSALYADNHFKVLKGTKIFDNDSIKFTHSEFCDSLNPFPLGITAKMSVVVHKNNDNVVVINYNLYNNSSENYDSLYFGLFSDVDILNSNYNSVNYNNLLNMLYFEDKNIPYTAVGFILPDSVTKYYYAIDNDGTNGSVGIANGINSAILNKLMKNNRYSAGGNYGNDVSCMLTYGPFFLNSGDSINLKFLMFVASNPEELIKKAFEYLYPSDSIHVSSINIDNIFIKYDSNNKKLIIENKTGQFIKISLYNTTGIIIYSTLTDNKDIVIPLSNYPNGIYLLHILNNRFNKVFKIVN